MTEKNSGINSAIAFIALIVSAVALYLVFDREKARKTLQGLKERLKRQKQGGNQTSPGA